MPTQAWAVFPACLARKKMPPLCENGWDMLPLGNTIRRTAMYPRVSDILNDLLGTQILLPAKTFGLFLALAFIAAFIALRRELVRKEQLGHYRLHRQNLLLESPLPAYWIAVHAAVWGLLGYKVGYMFVDGEAFSNHTEEILFSAKGYWLTGLLGIALGGGLKYREYAQRKHLKEKRKEVLVGPSFYVGTATTIAFVAGILGSKLFAMLEPGSNFWQDPLGDLMSFNGLSFFGGLICAGGLIIVYLYRKGFGVVRAIDGFAPCLILAYAVGRIGCQLSGDGDWGIVNELPNPGWLPDWAWAYTYPHNVALEGVPIPGCTGDFCRQLPQPVWPTPLYETLAGLGIFGVLMLLRTRLAHPGMLTSVWLILIGIERFGIEQIRVNSRYGVGLTQAELISILLILTGIGILVYALRKKDPMVIETARPTSEL
jgi:phosphatidylglycerol---prolipoprotein diacylglyceryl transferase